MPMKPVKTAALACGFALLAGASAYAAPDSYIGQIVAVGENYCPNQFMRTDGQLLAISSNTALFSVIGCTYGGDCQTTFALPDLRGRAMAHSGNGAGLPPVARGEALGAPTHTLTVNELPAHNHQLVGAVDGGGQFNSPAGHALPTYTDPTIDVYADDPPETSVQLNASVMGHSGGSQDFSLYQPTIVINYCIAVQGLYPPRS